MIILKVNNIFWFIFFFNNDLIYLFLKIKQAFSFITSSLLEPEAKSCFELSFGMNINDRLESDTEFRKRFTKDQDNKSAKISKKIKKAYDHSKFQNLVDKIGRASCRERV